MQQPNQEGYHAIYRKYYDVVSSLKLTNYDVATPTKSCIIWPQSRRKTSVNKAVAVSAMFLYSLHTIRQVHSPAKQTYRCLQTI